MSPVDEALRRLDAECQRWLAHQRQPQIADVPAPSAPPTASIVPPAAPPLPPMVPMLRPAPSLWQTVRRFTGLWDE